MGLANRPVGLLLWLLIPSAWAAALPAQVWLPATPVDAKGDLSVFVTPLAYRDGEVFSVDVEPPASGGLPDIDLRTVVRKGVQLANGAWQWQTKTLDDRTIRDPYHAQASLGLDPRGYVHVAYGMHNMPWQYSVSQKPLNISSFVFRGQPITPDELRAVKYLNHTPFPGSGIAAIPGNQVTYPMFFNDRHGALYLTYRFATRPARSWDERGFAGAIAKYDTNTGQWHAIGGALPIAAGDATIQDGRTAYHPFAFQNGYSVYLITLAFGPHNGMHVFWNWRPHGAGMNTILPSYAYSPDGVHFYKADGTPYHLPITVAQSGVIGNMSPSEQFYAPKSVAVLPNGDPLVILQPLQGGRVMYALDRQTGTWSAPEPSPDGASQIVVDNQGRIWAFATGLKVFMKPALTSPWLAMGTVGSALCYPNVLYVPAEARFIIHAITCGGHHATIVSFQY